MPRPATKKSTPSAPRGSSKRRAPPETPPTRQSKRTKTQPKKASTPTKSQYFKGKARSKREASDSTSEDKDDSESELSNGSDYEAPGASSSDEIEEEDNYSSEEQPRSGKKGGSAKKGAPTAPKKAEDDIINIKPGAKLPPGTRLVIQKPKARSAGNVPYEDNTIHPNTMLFLGDLAQNNERQWLKSHDPDYRQSLNDFNSFVESLTEKLTEADETIPELPTKDIVFRIYRDIRFSSDPTPYKPYFSAAWSRTGRKGPYAAYYVQIQPGGKSFVGKSIFHLYYSYNSYHVWRNPT